MFFFPSKSAVVVNQSICLFPPRCPVSNPKNEHLFFQWPLEMVHLPPSLSCGVDTLRLISPLDMSDIPAARTQTSELIMCLCCYYLFVLFYFSRNLNHGPNFYCSRLFKCRLKNERFCKALSVEIDGWVPGTGKNEAVPFCMVAWDLGIPYLSQHMLRGRVQRRDWRHHMKYLCKCFSRHEGCPQEKGDLQLGSVC